jgi:hypothetical protein
MEAYDATRSARGTDLTREPASLMCVEVRIRPAQPSSPGISGCLQRLSEGSGRTAELRHWLAVFLSDLAPESAFQGGECLVSYTGHFAATVERFMTAAE